MKIPLYNYISRMFSNFTTPNIHKQTLLNHHSRVSSRSRTHVRSCFAINSCELTSVTCCTLSPYTCFECVSIYRCWLRLYCWTNNRRTKYETRVARSSETKALLPPDVIRAYRKNGQARKLRCTSPWVTFKIGVGFCRTQRRTNHVVDRASSRRRRRDAHKTGWTKSRRVRAKVYARTIHTNHRPTSNRKWAIHGLPRHAFVLLPRVHDLWHAQVRSSGRFARLWFSSRQFLFLPRSPRIKDPAFGNGWVQVEGTYSMFSVGDGVFSGGINGFLEGGCIFW